MAHRPASSSAAHPPTEPVLVVEDHDETREMIEELLRFHGFSVETARDGGEALDWLQEHHPCLILLDLRMPGVDGWTFRRKQLKMPDVADVPVLLVTAYENDPRTQRLHADASITKPFDFDRLIDAVQRNCLK
jgi:CheY-like chemotaxis protein